MLLTTATFWVATLAAAPEIVQTIILNTWSLYETHRSLQSHSIFRNRRVIFLSLAKPLFWRRLAAELISLFVFVPQVRSTLFPYTGGWQCLNSWVAYPLRFLFCAGRLRPGRICGAEGGQFFA